MYDLFFMKLYITKSAQDKERISMLINLLPQIDW